MDGIDQNRVKNRLLRALPAAEFARLAPRLERHELALGARLLLPGSPIEAAWFLESGLGSIVTESPAGLRAESGLFGREGFSPVAFALGSDRTVSETTVQMAGVGLRIAAAALRDAFAECPALHPLLLRFAQALSVQTAYTALSNAVHPVNQRLARWLLMCHDRGDGNELGVTHEFLAVMLAVRRPTVTTALHVLEGEGLIRSQRGCVIIRNRAGLETFAGDAYGPPEQEYERLIGPFR